MNDNYKSDRKGTKNFVTTFFRIPKAQPFLCVISLNLLIDKIFIILIV